MHLPLYQWEKRKFEQTYRSSELSSSLVAINETFTAFDTLLSTALVSTSESTSILAVVTAAIGGLLDGGVD